MKPGGVVSLKRINSISFLHKNKLFLLMCISLIFGIIIGSFALSGNGKASDFADKIFQFYISGRQNIAFFNLFFSTLIVYFLVCFIYFTIGTSVIGVVLSPILCCIVGMYFGSLASYSYGRFGLKGVAFNAIVLVPSALAFSICLFFAAKEAFNFSSIIIKLTMPKSRPCNISVEFKTYCGRFVLVMIFCVVAALIDAAVSTSFLKFFTFD